MAALEETATSSGYVKLAPSAPLAPFVQHIRLVPPTLHDSSYVRLPDGQMELVLRSASNGEAEWLRVVGTRSAALRKSGGPSGCFCVVVRFKAGGGYPFFGVPVSELTDQLVALDLLWGGVFASLRDGLGAADDPRACLEATERALCAR